MELYPDGLYHTLSHCSLRDKVRFLSTCKDLRSSLLEFLSTEGLIGLYGCLIPLTQCKRRDRNEVPSLLASTGKKLQERKAFFFQLRVEGQHAPPLPRPFKAMCYVSSGFLRSLTPYGSTLFLSLHIQSTTKSVYLYQQESKIKDVTIIRAYPRNRRDINDDYGGETLIDNRPIDLSQIYTEVIEWYYQSNGQ